MARAIVFVFAIALAIATVSANTENIRFLYKPAQSMETSLAGRLRDVSEGILGIFRSSHIQHIAPSFQHQGQDWYKIEGRSGRNYEARVCWAASDPLQFNLDYDAEKGLLKVGYSPDYYSHLPELRKQPLPAKYEVVLNPIIFGLLPSDILATIGQVIVGGLVSYFLSGHLLNCI